MNITYLIGNGFDLSVGIDSSYKQFYDWYCSDQCSSENDNDTIKDLKKNIQKDSEENWSDLEIALGKYTENFTLDTAALFTECYEDIHSKMILYIKQLEDKYTLKTLNSEELDNLKNGFCNFYQELNPKERRLFEGAMQEDRANSTTIDIISFNYTTILDSYIKVLSEKTGTLNSWTYNSGKRYIKINPKILHVNGLANNYPVLGVTNKNDVANPDLLDNLDIRDSLLKRNHVNYLGEFWYDDTEKKINNSRFICIFGMSLGQSDSLWWEKILSWLRQRSNRHLIIFWYSSETVDNVSVIKRRQEIEPVKDKLLGYSSSTDNGNSDIRTRIHIIINTQKVLVIPSLKKIS